MENPFLHRNAIRDASYFYGREDLTREVIQLLGRPQSVAITGPRTGKTSFLFHLQHHFRFHQESPQVCCVFFDCLGSGQAGAGQIYRALLKELKSELRAIAPHLAFPDISPVPDYDEFSETIERLGEQRIRVIFLLDKFDAIYGENTSHLNGQFFDGLRHLEELRVAYVIASKKSVTDLRRMPISSPFLNPFIQLYLLLFERREAQALLTGLSQRGNRIFPPDMITFLLELCGPHPLLLQKGGFHAFEQYADKLHLDGTFYEKVREAFIQEAEPSWQSIWEQFTPLDQLSRQKQLAQDQRDLALFAHHHHEMSSDTKFRWKYVGAIREEHGKLLMLSPAFQEFVSQQQVALEIAPQVREDLLIQIPPLVIDCERRVVWCHQKQREVPKRLFKLLCCLSSQAGRSIPASQLISQIWSNEEERARAARRKNFSGFAGTLEARIKDLREVLKDCEVSIEKQGERYRLEIHPHG